MVERTKFPSNHVIHMSLDHADPKQSISVAACDCGWVSRVPWPHHDAEQDAAVEDHWRDVESRTSD